MRVDRKDDRVIIQHDKGAYVELLLYGATVISWKSGTKGNPVAAERLFVSTAAVLDGSKAVRGGIPVVFPCFGPPTHPQHSKLPQHGFARSEVWKWDQILTDNDAEVSVQLTLEPTPSIAEKYNKPFKLAFIVKLTEYQLTTELHVRNTSNTDVLEFQALFHNYIRAPSRQVLVSSLQHRSYYDKTAPTEEGRSTSKKETRESVDVKNYTDSVYENVSQQYQITWPLGGVEMRTSELKDLVIWNPQEQVGSKLVDMEEGGWEKFVCVEPGYVRGFIQASPGKTWVGTQALSVIHENNTRL
jgi:glucose-6-phosphate 1-epimerase